LVEVHVAPIWWFRTTTAIIDAMLGVVSTLGDVVSYDDVAIPIRELKNRSKYSNGYGSIIATNQPTNQPQFLDQFTNVSTSRNVLVIDIPKGTRVRDC
jgi:membrane glycosyltransferase